MKEKYRREVMNGEAEKEIQKGISKPFSYMDSATGYLYFNLVPSDFDTLRDRLETALNLKEVNRDKYAKELLKIGNRVLWTEFRSIFFHEWHHCLQTIFYPYRYLQSWRELFIAFEFLSYLRRSEEAFKIGQLVIHEDWSDTIKYYSMIIGLDIVDGKLVPILDRNPNEVRPTDFTITDLLEEATSIFEFKVEIGRDGDGQSYYQWIRSRKLSGKTTYSNIFYLLSRLMGKEGAYVALPALVQASFSTTWPAITFIALVNYTLARSEVFKPEELNCDSYYSILREQLVKPFFADSGQFPDPSSPAKSDDYYFLDFDSYQRIVTSTPKHTVHYQASRFIDRIKTDPELETILFHPYRTDAQSLLKQEFFPPIICLRIHLEPLLARDSILIVNPFLGNVETPQGIIYSEYWREIMKKKDVAYSLFTDINNYLEHNCHHLDCPYHETNVCRRWSAIPREWKTCAFPGWFESVVGMTIDLKSKELKKIA